MFKQYQLFVILLTHIVRGISIQVPPALSYVPTSLSSSSSSSSVASLLAASPILAVAPTAPAALTSTSVKPSTLLLPPGFDSQLPPRQPMLYPFVVPSSLKPTPATRKPIGPFITPGWIPISSSLAKEVPTLTSSSTTTSSTTTTTTTTTTTSTTTTPKPYSAPVLEDRISKYVLATNENGPVFESIVYGTWKPDPPLQPVEMANTTTSTSKVNFNHHGTIISVDNHAITSTSNVGDGGIIGNAATETGGKVVNKTIHRQHGEWNNCLVDPSMSCVNVFCNVRKTFLDSSLMLPVQ